MQATDPRFQVPWERDDDGAFVLHRRDGQTIARVREHRPNRWVVEWAHRRGAGYSVNMEPSARDAQIIAEVALYGHRIARWLNPSDPALVSDSGGETVAYEEHYELEGRVIEVIWNRKDGEDFEVRIVRPEDTNLTPQEFNTHYGTS